MRNGERDVYYDPSSKKYRKSSTWQRRLRRLARHHAQRLIEMYMIPGEVRPNKVDLLIKEWRKEARNG